MKLKAKTIGLDAGGKIIIILNKKDADYLGVFPLNRVVVRNNNKKITAIVNTTRKFVKPGKAIVYNELKEELDITNNDIISVTPRESLESKKFIREKISNKKLNYKKYLSIVKDLIDRDLNDLEISAFITALEINGMDIKETADITRAMVNTSEKIDFKEKVFNKHSVGGIPGDKTSIFVVPILSSLGYTIPKTSSRAITDPAGTADRMEVFADVEFSSSEIKKLVQKTNSCIVLGGHMDLSPADDLFIQVEHPLGMDPLMIPSVLSKKKVVGSQYVVIDLPAGKFGKVKTKKQAQNLGRTIKKVGKKLGMEISFVKTKSNQPLGYAMGPTLEAREILKVFENPKNASRDLIKKIKMVSKELMELAGSKKDPLKILKSGQAEKKFREIIKNQDGNPNIKPEDIKLGKYKKKIFSNKKGKIKELNSNILKNIAMCAGSPSMKKSGLLLNKKLNQKVGKNELLYTIYSEHKDKLKDALKLAKNNIGVKIK